MSDFLVSKADDGRVWAVNDDFSLVKGPDGWAKGAPSADDLKDNFSRVKDPKEAATLFQEAAAAVKANPNLLRANLQGD